MSVSVPALKLLIVGNSNTGKSCLTLRFVEESFTEVFVATVGIDFHVKIVELSNGKKVKLQLWDTAGQERFHNVTRTYFRGAAAVLLVYDVTDKESFDWIPKWREQAIEYVGGDASSIVLAIVGSKADLSKNRVISEEQGEELARELGVSIFFETSAKVGTNVTELFMAVAEAAAKKLPNLTVSSTSSSAAAGGKGINLSEKPTSTMSGAGCC